MSAKPSLDPPNTARLHEADHCRKARNLRAGSEVMTKVSIRVLKQLIRSDADSGKLFWRTREDKWFQDKKQTAIHACAKWNSRYADTEALLALNAGGYRHGKILSKKYLAHRVIWAIETGAWPVGEIDHINNDRSDNRICNLRQASSSENSRNTKSRRGSSSQYLGVSWVKRIQKWQASLQVSGKRFFLGNFDLELDAARAYDVAAARHFGQFANLNFKT